MSSATKDTIYIDVDDEITTIIEKVRSSEHKIIAIVLPKRAATLQSVVNMKLLKRAAEQDKKRIVIITSEAGLLPVAGIVGLHVAKTLQSKPYIPSPPDKPSAAETLTDDGEPEIDPKKSVGELADIPDGSAEHVSLGAMAVEETIDIDDLPSDIDAGPKGKKSKKNKIKIPNFESFRLRLILGFLLLIALIVGWFMAFNVLPKVSVIVRTDTSTVASSLSLTANTTAKAVDVEKAVVPAEVKEVKKTDTLKVPATGQKNVGDKAKGTMTVYNCTDAAVPVPAGTLFTNSGFSFSSDAAVTVPASDFFSNGNCKKNTSASVAVTAVNSGGASNLSSGRSYSSNFASTLTGTGSAMAGGTDKNITVISQKDVDDAKTKLTDKSKDTATNELAKLFTDAKLIPVNESIVGNPPAVTVVPNVGDEVAEATVTAVTTYQMLGIKEDFLKQLVDLDAKKQIDLAKQPIVDYGFDKAIFHVTDRRSALDQSVAIQTIASTGTKIDPEALKKEIIGKKRGDVENIVQAHPGVKDVTVNYSPFWVAKVPKKTARITIVFEQSNAK